VALVGHTEIYIVSHLVLYCASQSRIVGTMQWLHLRPLCVSSVILSSHRLHFWFAQYESLSRSPSLHLKLKIYSPVTLSSKFPHYAPILCTSCKNNLEYSVAEFLLGRLR
jgi:hypothetical protein